MVCAVMGICWNGDVSLCHGHKQTTSRNTLSTLIIRQSARLLLHSLLKNTALVVGCSPNRVFP